MTKTEWLKTILTEPRFTFLCEILFWFNPQKSLAYLSLFNIFIHLIYFFTKNGIIYVTAYFLLFRLWKPIWTDRIWPHIQTPEFSLLSDWTTLDPSLPDYEISMNLIEEKLEKYFNRFVKMKNERHLNFSFALYSSITCLFGIFIGQKISGIYLFYLAFILVTAVPIIFRDEILGKVKQLEEEASIAIKIEELSKLPKKPQKPLYRKLSSEELAVQKRKSFVDIGSSEEESDDRSTPDPNPEPTWMEDLSYTIQQTTAEAVSSVKSQLEEAISCRLGSEPVRYADSSSSEDHSDFVLLDREEEN